MTLYQRFQNSSLETRDIGLDVGQEDSSNVFSPLGARVIGWGEDGWRHFCFVDGFGEMVFSVDFKARAGDGIQPVARNFPDFLGLIAACKGTAPLLQTSRTSRQHFQALLESQKCSRKQQSILRALQNCFLPPIISDPYGYIKDIQAAFNYSALPLHPDYGEHCPLSPGGGPWQVYFGSDFLPLSPSGKPGKELPFSASFSWADTSGKVLALYQCADGIVLDCCTEIPIERIKAFYRKWGYLEGKSQPTLQEQLMMEVDRPYPDEVTGVLYVNGKSITPSKCSYLHWDPLRSSSWKDCHILDHYHCSRETGWMLLRMCFPWKPGRRKSAIRALSLTLSAPESEILGPQFTTPLVGGILAFTDPQTGTAHKLTVVETNQEFMDPNFLLEGPRQFTVMTYFIEPELPDGMLQIRDSGKDDHMQPSDGFLGGADGPTAVIYGRPADGLHVAISARHYEPVDQIQWQMIFRQKQFQDVTVPLA